MKLKDLFLLLIWILIAFIPGAFGSIFTSPNIPTWYAALNKPIFNPPGWVFAPVWTLLYLLMGIAAFLIWNKGIENKKVKLALIIFLAQLVLNGLWSLLFFGQHWILISFIEIVILWCFILWTIVKFYTLSPLAGLILIPYLFWVSFASVLNFSFWILNK
jgi:benzodiazapine receptor